MRVEAPLPSGEIIRKAALNLAPILIRTDYQLSVMPSGIVEVRNPVHRRMTKHLAVMWHDPTRTGNGAWFWHWVSSGPRRESPPEYRPMVSVDQPDEAARQVINALSPVEPTVRA